MFIFSNKTTLDVRSSLFFVHISLQALYDYDVKVTYFSFLEDVNDFLFVFLNFDTIQCLRIHLQRKLPTFDKLNEME